MNVMRHEVRRNQVHDGDARPDRLVGQQKEERLILAYLPAPPSYSGCVHLFERDGFHSLPMQNSF